MIITLTSISAEELPLQNVDSTTELKDEKVSSTLTFDANKDSGIEDSFISWEVPNDDSIAVLNCANWYSTRDEHRDLDIGDEKCNMESEILADGLPKFQQEEKLNSVECLEFAKVGPVTEQKTDFTYAELYKATNGFSSKNFISEGGFGLVFKGVLSDGQWIAVKQHKDASMQGDKEFRSEVQVLSTASHKNVVKLFGSCSEGNHRLLVYEYVSNGSLDMHLSSKNSLIQSLIFFLYIAIAIQFLAFASPLDLLQIISYSLLMLLHEVIETMHKNYKKFILYILNI